MSWSYGWVVAGLVMLVPQVASATGLVGQSTQTGASTLTVLQDLTLQVTLSEQTATIDEVRQYAAPNLAAGAAAEPGVVGSVEVRFYRSFAGDAPTSVTAVTVNGAPLSGTLLEGAEADAIRRELTKSLHDPAPLRELGAPLWVSDPIPQNDNKPVYGGWTIAMKLEVELAPRSTLVGLALPLDWKRGTIGLEVTATATTDRPLRALYSPYHPLQVERTGAHMATGTFKSYGQPTEFPVTLMLSTGSDPWHLDLLPFRYSDAEGGFVMALLTPHSTPPEQGVAPRDIVLVLDRSGSMANEKIAQAKEALTAVLGGLRPQDSFAVVSFHAYVETWEDDAVPANDANVADAQGFVADIVADGGTNIYGALETAYETLPHNVGNPRYIVMLTDGQPTEGITDTTEIVDMVRLKNEVGARIFSFGIGNDVNTVLLEKLAAETGGDAIYIQPGSNVATAVAQFFEQVVAPVMATPTLDLSAFGAEAIYPASLPDLFAGKTVSLLARYTTPGVAGEVTLSGTRQGQAIGAAWDVTLPSYHVVEGWVPSVWATRHVGSLLHQAKLEGGNALLEQEAVAIADRYGIVTEFTFYATDEDGDSVMKYSEVPLDEVGSKAVSTSASLDSYEDGDSVLTRVTQDVRYHRDRVLPLRGGYYTDSTLGALETPAWIDLHFASDRYFEVADAEVAHGMGGFLSVGHNLRFELLGRAFRVTDGSAPPVEIVPPETVTIPPATAIPPGIIVAATPRDEPYVPQPPVELDAFSGEEPGGCSTGAGPADATPAALALLILAALGVLRRRRPVVAPT